MGRLCEQRGAHWLDRGIALAYVKPDYAEPGTALEIDVLRERRPAVVLLESPHDPDNGRLRA